MKNTENLNGNGSPERKKSLGKKPGDDYADELSGRYNPLGSMGQGDSQ